MNILYSILYAALTVVLALAPFGVLYLKSKNQVSARKVTGSFIWYYLICALSFAFVFSDAARSNELLWLYQLLAVLLIISPFLTRIRFGVPKTFLASFALSILFIALSLLTILGLAPLAIGRLSF